MFYDSNLYREKPHLRNKMKKLTIADSRSIHDTSRALQHYVYPPLIYVKDEDRLVYVVSLQHLSRTHARVHYILYAMAFDTAGLVHEKRSMTYCTNNISL
jgi:hypothetical protein